MPRRETTPMDQRLQVVAEAQRSEEAFTTLRARYGIAPRTGYQWLARSAAAGPAGLPERSRRPHTSPTATPRPRAWLPSSICGGATRAEDQHGYTSRDPRRALPMSSD